MFSRNILRFLCEKGYLQYDLKDQKDDDLGDTMIDEYLGWFFAVLGIWC